MCVMGRKPRHPSWAPGAENCRVQFMLFFRMYNAEHRPDDINEAEEEIGFAFSALDKTSLVL
jgi:hypothetical protein